MYFGRFWKLIKLSLLTFVFCIPVVTIGPAIAGMTKVLRCYQLDKDTFIWHEFWKGFSQNWKKSLPAGLIDVAFGVSLICLPWLRQRCSRAAAEPSTMFCA